MYHLTYNKQQNHHREIKVKVNIENSEKITNLLTTVQKGCSVRLIDYSDIINIINDIDTRAKTMRIGMTNLSGAEFHFKNGTKVAASYFGAPKSTQFKLYRGSRAWFITEIKRDYCNYLTTLKFQNENKFKSFYNF